MKKYIGTKTVYAQPMTAEEATEKGYKVGDNTGNGYEVEYKDGYKSWSPDKAFEEAYRVAETPLDRLEIELSELDEKIIKLKGFLVRHDNAELVEILGTEQVKLMNIQFHAMKTYYYCLYSRIVEIKDREDEK
jgi:hypothetical protein